jgi:hypothetical protein
MNYFDFRFGSPCPEDGVEIFASVFLCNSSLTYDWSATPTREFYSGFSPDLHLELARLEN